MNDYGLTDDEFWASLDRELEKAVHGSRTRTDEDEARMASFDREGEEAL